jgi:hypothetical protein
MQLNRNGFLPNSISDLNVLKELHRKSPSKILKTKNRQYNHIISSDYHAPYTNLEGFHKMCEEYAGECATLHIVGDILDGGCLSSHDKLHFSPNLQTEVDFTIELINHALKYFDYVKLYSGNHDLKRFQKTIHKHVKNDIHFLLKDPFQYILDQFDDRVEFCNTPIKDTEFSVNWFGSIGKDAIVSHSEAYAKNNVSIIRTSEWFLAWNKQLKMSDEIRFISQGHTHQLSQRFLNGIMLVENGSMVRTAGLSYSFDGNCRYNTLNQNGFCVLYQDKLGYTDLEKTRIIPIIS